MDVKEVFTNTYTETEHHFTLYYYDQSNNLVMTVPPEAVRPFNLSEMGSINQARNNGLADVISYNTAMKGFLSQGRPV